MPHPLILHSGINLRFKMRQCRAKNRLDAERAAGIDLNADQITRATLLNHSNDLPHGDAHALIARPSWEISFGAWAT